jgi:hypothetical protein
MVHFSAPALNSNILKMANFSVTCSQTSVYALPYNDRPISFFSANVLFSSADPTVLIYHLWSLVPLAVPVLFGGTDRWELP